MYLQELDLKFRRLSILLILQNAFLGFFSCLQIYAIDQQPDVWEHQCQGQTKFCLKTPPLHRQVLSILKTSTKKGIKNPTTTPDKSKATCKTPATCFPKTWIKLRCQSSSFMADYQTIQLFDLFLRNILIKKLQHQL